MSLFDQSFGGFLVILQKEQVFYESKKSKVLRLRGLVDGDLTKDVF
jgi:hypothetical protein